MPLVYLVVTDMGKRTVDPYFGIDTAVFAGIEEGMDHGGASGDSCAPAKLSFLRPMAMGYILFSSRLLWNSMLPSAGNRDRFFQRMRANYIDFPIGTI